MPDPIQIIFLFALGTCIGSFLNVVVYRLPRIELPIKVGLIGDMVASFKALSSPPSHCPNCNIPLKWYDNIPVFGWIKLLGRCRFCRKKISIRYPIVELLTGLIFVGYFLAYYGYQVRTCCPQPAVTGFFTDVIGNEHILTSSRWILHDSWPIFALYLTLLSGLLAASLIDAELYIIPLQIPILLAALGFIVHGIVDKPTTPGSLNLLGVGGPACAALAAGGAIGLLISLLLWSFGIIPTSFADGDPMLEVDRDQLKEAMDRALKAGEIWQEGPLPPEYTPAQIRREISKEMLFLMPPLIVGGAFVAGSKWIPMARNHWAEILSLHPSLSGLLGSILGALVGAFVVWITRILGTLVFRKVAMGLGDVHLMFGVGAVIGAAGATIAFFIAPFFAILLAIYTLIFRRGREIPLGPFLSMATALVMLLYCPIMERLEPGFQGLAFMIGELLQHGSK